MRHDTFYQEAKKILQENKEMLTELVEILLEKNDVSYLEIESLAEKFGVSHERTMIYIPEV